MNRRSAVRNLLTATAGLLLPPFTSGAGQDFTIHSDVRLVLLDVSVRDHAGLPVAGLAKNNFTVLESGHPRVISVFAKDDLPVTVGVLVDESESMRSKRADVLAAAQAFIQESNPKDELFVLNFNDTVKRGLPARMMYSGDARELRQALNRGVPEGKTALNDAIAEGLEMLQSGTRGRKALLVISDGGDNASHHRRDQITSLIETRLATIYTVGLYDRNERETDPNFLRRLAKTSGGEVFFPDRPSETIDVCRAIARDIRSRYTLGYVPEPGQALRRLSVKVASPDHRALFARTRTSYRYDTHAE